MLVTTDHLELNYTTSDDLTIDYYKKTDADNMLLSYSTGSYVDYNLANEVSTTGDATISGNLDVGSGPSSRIGSNASASGYTAYSEVNTASPWDLWINLETIYPNGGWMYFKINNDSCMQLSGSANKVNIYKDTAITGRLDVGENPNCPTNWINLHTDNTTGNGFSGVMQFSVWGGKNGTWDINSNTTDGKIEIKLDGNRFMKFFNNTNEIRYCKTLVNSSDDRLKENEELIENACETLSELRPQLYDKKPDIENDDPTKWYKESGLIAQEIYYDTPELRHFGIKR